MIDIDALARALDRAAQTATPIVQSAEALSPAQGYQVQAAWLELRRARGERRIGAKLGYTSCARLAELGLHEPLFGRLTDAMLIGNGSAVDCKRFIRARAECEIAFLIGRELSGAVTALRAAAAIEAVAPAIEIIDSRYRDFRFSLGDVIADNVSASALVLGPWSRGKRSLGSLAMRLLLDGAVAQAGSSAAILGHPLRSLVAAARLLAEAGERLEPGDVVLAGTATPPQALRAGAHVRIEVERLGAAEFTLL